MLVRNVLPVVPSSESMGARKERVFYNTNRDRSGTQLKFKPLNRTHDLYLVLLTMTRKVLIKLTKKLKSIHVSTKYNNIGATSSPQFE